MIFSEYRYFDELDGISIRIEVLKNKILMSKCSVEKTYYEGEIVKEISRASDIVRGMQKDYKKGINKYFRQGKEFTLEELEAFDGTDGKPAYTAVNGIVYDVTNEPTWGGASHFGLTAGRDVTEEFNKCHRGVTALEKLSKIGTLKI